MSAESSSKKSVSILIKGIVQGVGFRPFVYREAKRYALSGYVANTPEGVLIEVEGRGVDAFVEALNERLPERARIDSLVLTPIPSAGHSDFEIRDSTVGQGDVAIPLDTALCSACRSEMDDPLNRRYRYPFINCTDCGPRYTIIQIPPYDRVRTSMKHFTMCPECGAEYADPASRRYHAEPISCPNCGPKLSFWVRSDPQSPSERVDCPRFAEVEGDPVDLAVLMLREGKIVALKGLGGFHLMCDATSDEAVAELRRRKRRNGKPLAVMFSSLEQLHRYADMSGDELEHITGPLKPIVIVRAKEGSGLCEYVAPQIGRVGVFLPYTPLHRLVCEKLPFPLVATSANVSDEPILTRFEEVAERLGDVADAILDHDRPIVNALDDSVIQIAQGRVVTLRMGRGLAPLTLPLARPLAYSVLALGAHQKSAVALGVKQNMVLGGHIGDLGSVEADAYFERNIQTFKRFYDTEPLLLAGDLHPLYASTRYLRDQKKEYCLVQHHHAHILACMAEHALDEKVLGFAFDGTGYGENGELWGGEVMIADAHGYERIGHLKPFALLGGDKAVREPRRIALALLFERYGLDEVLSLESPAIQSFLPHEIRQLHHMWTKKLNAPQSSSMGRLFDAVASLGGFVQKLDYEGQGGMIMERYVDDAIVEPFAFEVREGVIDVSEMIARIVESGGGEDAKPIIASRFIATVEAMISHFAALHPDVPVVVGGGVFQNLALMRRLYRRFGKGRFYAQQQTPPNDGSIALGQLYYAIHNKGDL